MSGKSWLDAATLILTLGQRNLRLLLLKRSSKSSFFPSSHVFPGGAVDPADFSQDWLRILADFGRPDFRDPGYQTRLFVSKHRADLFTRYPRVPLLPEIAFRICAIRETFEESGLLLACDKEGHRHFFDLSTSSFDLKDWQVKVKEDARQFLELFSVIQLIPDLTSLHEWADWLTPSSRSRRYDTAFFISSIPMEFLVSRDKAEMSAHSWMTPKDAIEAFTETGDVELPPPTFYEISKLLRFEDLESLEDFSRRRSLEGLQMTFPVLAFLNDLAISFYYGDVRYPAQVDHANPVNLDISDVTEEDLVKDFPKHRLVYRLSSDRATVIAQHCDVDLPFGMPRPKPFLRVETASKL